MWMERCTEPPGESDKSHLADLLLSFLTNFDREVNGIRQDRRKVNAISLDNPQLTWFVSDDFAFGSESL
jgi:hypothetical protein